MGDASLMATRVSVDGLGGAPSEEKRGMAAKAPGRIHGVVDQGRVHCSERYRILMSQRLIDVRELLQLPNSFSWQL